jgi:hypothetical protein
MSSTKGFSIDICTSKCISGYIRSGYISREKLWTLLHFRCHTSRIASGYDVFCLMRCDAVCRVSDSVHLSSFLTGKE